MPSIYSYRVCFSTCRKSIRRSNQDMRHSKYATASSFHYIFISESPFVYSCGLVIPHEENLYIYTKSLGSSLHVFNTSILVLDCEKIFIQTSLLFISKAMLQSHLAMIRLRLQTQRRLCHLNAKSVSGWVIIFSR